MNIARRDASPVSAYRPAYRSGSIDDQLGRMVESMFENMLAPMAPLGVGGADNMISPRVHIAETDKTYEIETELPGVNKNDVKINIDARRVTIEAEELRETQEKEGQKTLYSERSVRHYARTFTLPPPKSMTPLPKPSWRTACCASCCRRSKPARRKNLK